MSAPTSAPAKPVEPFGPEDFARETAVSRETLARLKAYAGMLGDWNARHNLVSKNSLAEVWRRHIWDSAQLQNLIAPSARTLVDLGSGAGFPGVVLAILLSDRLRLVLYEATRKKCEFLSAVGARLELPIEVRNARIEDAGRRVFDIVTARACAPLPKLLGYAQHFTGAPTQCLFLKGQNVEDELTEAHKSWRMLVQRHQSVTDRSGVILEIRELAPHGG